MPDVKEQAEFLSTHQPGVEFYATSDSVMLEIPTAGEDRQQWTTTELVMVRKFKIRGSTPIRREHVTVIQTSDIDGINAEYVALTEEGEVQYAWSWSCD